MIERKKTVDNIYSTFDSPSNFNNIFKQSRKSSLIGLTATRKDMDPFKDILKVFFPEFKNKIKVKVILNQIGFDVKNKIEADYFIEDLGLIFEFDGPPHYSNPFKIVADERKRNLVENLTKNEKKTEVRIVRIPYYFQLTKDVAKFLFNDLIKHYSKDLKNLSSNGYFSEDKFYSAISKTYLNLFSGEGASDENEVLSCGLHRSKEVPSTFCESGIEKLLKDFKFFRSVNDDEKISVPKSVEHQYMWSLKYFLDDVQTYEKDEDNKKLILPTWHKEFMDRYKENINNKNESLLNCLFLRDYDSVVKTKNY